MSGEPVTRTFVVIDIEDSGKRTNPGVTELRRSLYEIFDYARSASGIPRERVMIEDRGDGIMAVADAELLPVLDRGLDALVEDLATHNRKVEPPDWLRLRVALNRGLVHHDAFGWSGADLTTTFRLANDGQVKKALKQATRAQCVVVVSDSVYDGMIKQGYGNLSPSTYTRLRDVPGWVRVPGYPIPPAAEEPEPSRPVDGGGPHRGTNYVNHFERNNITNVDASTRVESERRP